MCSCSTTTCWSRRGVSPELLDRAEATGAGLVGPVYLERGPRGELSIHMAGGFLQRTDGDHGDIEVLQHRLQFRPVEEAAELAAGPVDFVEHHCMLARTDFVRTPDAISDEVVLVHEHMDLALKARAAGLSVWLEPAARVTYVAAAPERLSDIAFYRRRWDLAACQASMAAFARRWPLADETRFNRGIHSYLRERLASVRLTRAAAEADASPMTPELLPQTRLGLRERAAGRGYGPSDLRAIEAGCDFATLIFDGLYRPDGRPFLNHVIGTAGALVARDLRIEVVLAGLLHAAYSHRPGWMDEAEVTGLLASGGAVEAIVRALPAAKAQLKATDRGQPPTVGGLTILEAQALAVEAASEADMRLAGEYRASGRPPRLGERALGFLAEVLQSVELDALAADAASPAGDAAPSSILGFGPLHSSFRLDAAARRLDPIRPRA